MAKFEIPGCPGCGVKGNHKLKEIPCGHVWHIGNGMFNGNADLEKCELILMGDHDVFYLRKI